MGIGQYVKDRWERNRSALLFMALGLAMVAVAEPLRTALEKHVGAGQPPGSRRIVWTDLFAYTFEHLGAVLFVAMVVRIGIEEAAQERANHLAVEQVKSAMKEKLDAAFQSVDEKVKLFNTAVDKVGTGVETALQSFNEKVLDVNQKMESMQTVLGGNLYGHRLSPADRTEIGKVYLNPEFFRPLYRLELTLKPLPNEIIEVCIETDAQIENISKDVAEHRVSARLDNVLVKSRAGSVKAESKMIRFEFGPETEAGRQQASLQAVNFDKFTPDELKQKKLLREDGTDLIFEYPFGIRIPPNETYFVKVVASQLMREGDLFVWKMFVATQKLVVVVHLADGLTADTFEVVARPVHHRDHPNFLPTISEGRRRLEWTIDGVLLPYQGVELWWSRKDSGVAQA
jgi:hypothetical protein